ncbi:hypothetical protein [Pseudomonas indica]|uniref:hypothetical protein n=1 Tax=Pseudomonas indica TaxID=137658 RepID=UPI003FCFC4CE
MTIYHCTIDIANGVMRYARTPSRLDGLLKHADGRSIPGEEVIPTERARQIEADVYAYLRQTYLTLSEDEARRLAADGPRYKAIGNSKAVPVVRWIGRRIQRELERVS